MLAGLVYDVGDDHRYGACSCISDHNDGPWTKRKAIFGPFAKQVQNGNLMENVERIHIAVAQYQDALVAHLRGDGRWTTNEKKQLYGKERFKEIQGCLWNAHIRKDGQHC